MGWYGNLNNRLMEGPQDIIPTVGMGCTQLSWSDRDPYTVVEIISKNKIKVRADQAKNIGNHFYDQEWEITRDPEGTIKTLINTKKGWKVLKGSTRFILGVREKYYDYEF